jgi:DNA-binding transcriptional MerR regulator
MARNGYAGTIAPVAEPGLTIDELAREVGMTVRNVRAHQSRGLLPPPEVRSRTGSYGPAHVARLKLIQEMQAEGFNLKAIERLLPADGGDAALLDFRSSLLNAFGEEEPELVTTEDLVERFGERGAAAISRAVKLGLVRPIGEDRFEVPSPTMLRAGEEITRLGVPLEHALAVAGKVQRSSRSIAEAFVRLFVSDLLGSGDPAALSAEEWARLREALERLRPLATDVVRASFEQAMSAEIEQQVAKLLGGKK